jgi:hypothetical protein
MNDTVIILCFFLYRAELWTDSPDVPCRAQTVKHCSARRLCAACIFISETDFTSSECIHLNRMVVPTLCATSRTTTCRTYPTLSLLWVSRHHLLPVQVTFLFRNESKPVPRCSQRHAKHFRVQIPPFHLVVLTKMIVVGNSGVSAFSVLPKAQCKAFCAKKKSLI